MKLSVFILTAVLGTVLFSDSMAAVTEDESGRIVGKVASTAGGSVAGATIILFENGAVKFSTRTDKNGNFSFVNIPPGMYQISAKKPGFADFAKSIKINPRFTLKIKFDMQSKDQPVAPAPAVVKADLPANPQMTVKATPATEEKPAERQETLALQEDTPVGDSEILVESEGTTDEVPEFVANPEVLPEPEGGIVALYKNIKYPELAIKRGAEGTVLVNVTVDKTGTVLQVDIVKSVDPILDEAAINTIYVTRFIPASHQGKTVTSTVGLPVRFKLK